MEISTMARPANLTIDDLDSLVEYRITSFANGMSYVSLIGACGYTVFGVFAMWLLRSRFRLYTLVEGVHGIVVVPNSTYVLLSLSIPFSLLDCIYSTYMIYWNQRKVDSSHWILLFGIRYVPAVTFLWFMLAATACIWPFPAHKMRFPRVWNVSILLVPIALMTAFLYWIRVADIYNAQASEQYAALKHNGTMPDMSSPQAKEIMALYSHAASVSRYWAWIGAGWSATFLLCLFVASVHTVAKWVRDYTKMRDAIHEQERLRRIACGPGLVSTNSTSEHVPVRNHDPFTSPSNSRPGTRGEEVGQGAAELLAAPPTPFVAVNTSVSSFARSRQPSPSGEVVDLESPERQLQDKLAALDQLRNLMIHSGVQLFAIWACQMGSFASFFITATRMNQIATKDKEGHMITIVFIAVQAAIIEKILWFVLGWLYITSVLIRIRQGQRAKPASCAPQIKETESKYVHQPGLLLSSTTGRDLKPPTPPPVPNLSCPSLAFQPALAGQDDRETSDPGTVSHGAKSFEQMRRFHVSSSSETSSVMSDRIETARNARTRASLQDGEGEGDAFALTLYSLPGRTNASSNLQAEGGHTPSASGDGTQEARS